MDGAKTLAAEGSYDEAARFYRQVIDMAPGNGKALVGLGVVRLMEGRLAEAADAFSAALEAHPDDAGALCGLGMARDGEGDHDGAFALYRRSLDADPENLTALHELLKAGYRFDRLAEAEPYLQGYLMYHPADGHILFSLAGLQYRTGRIDEAYDNLERLLILEPAYEGGADLYGAVGQALAERDGSALRAAGR
jgi:tetratricopeptide (TPR) repeat protein